ncbi:hypothetical protein FACS1894211_12890 [Clostridia bacterium]|nr:hypothetical protein FACS1894211_12890 [Clostridia bacterium]
MSRKRKGKKILPVFSQSAKNYLDTRDHNVSNKIKRGQTVMTRDNYFYGSKDYDKLDKSGKPIAGNYRPAVVADTNELDEMGLIKQTRSEGGKAIKKGSNFKPFIEIRDNEGKPIKQGKKFILTSKRVSSKVIDSMMTDSITDKKTASENLKRLRRLKNRKKNPPPK